MPAAVRVQLALVAQRFQLQPDLQLPLALGGMRLGRRRGRRHYVAQRGLAGDVVIAVVIVRSAHLERGGSLKTPTIHGNYDVVTKTPWTDQGVAQAPHWASVDSTQTPMGIRPMPPAKPGWV